MKILEIKNLTKSFQGVCAINNLSLSVEQGVVTGIIGPNGSGKTTLINVLSGIVPFESGHVVVGGLERNKFIRPYHTFDYGIVRTFQNIRLFEQMTVSDNILAVISQKGVLKSIFDSKGKDRDKKVRDVLKKVGLWKKRNELAINLSYGQKKLLEIARTFVVEAKIILFDEPFAGLSKEMKKKVYETIQKLKDEGVTVILVEHDIGLVENICEYVFVLDEGRLIADGQPKEVLKKKEVREVYLGN